MRRRETPGPCRLVILALAVALGSAPEASAQIIDDLGTLTNPAAPNLTVLLDDSISMRHHMWDDGFDVSKLYSGFCSWPEAPTLSGTSCPGIGNPLDECPDNDYVLATDVPHVVLTTAAHSECGVTRSVYFGGGPADALYSLNYLNWLFGVATAAELIDEPTVTRIEHAKAALTTLLVALEETTVGGGLDGRVILPALASFDEQGAGAD